MSRPSSPRQTSRRPDVQTSHPSHDSNPSRRRTTVYFDPTTFRDIKVYCATEGLELSATINQAVLQFLNAQES